MKTIKENVTTQIIEKKSKFIANLFYVSSVEDAENQLQQIRKQHYDARHNCFAYRIGETKDIIEKASDDGEPSGTAGAPMLNLLQKQNLTNVLVVVTRYFGGILLGTGGLVRAYTQAAKEALEKVEIVKEELRIRIAINFTISKF